MIQCFECGGAAKLEENDAAGMVYGCACGKKLRVDPQGSVLVLAGDEWRTQRTGSG